MWYFIQDGFVDIETVEEQENASWNSQWVHYSNSGLGMLTINRLSINRQYAYFLQLICSIYCLSLELDLQNRSLILWYVVILYIFFFIYKLLQPLSFPIVVRGEKESLYLPLFSYNSYRVIVVLYKTCGERTTLWWKDSGAANKRASLTNWWICSTSTPRRQGCTSSRWSVSRPLHSTQQSRWWWNSGKDQT